jgi:hypothetical protein
MVCIVASIWGCVTKDAPQGGPPEGGRGAWELRKGMGIFVSILSQIV